MKIESINMGTLWTMLTGTALAVVYMFTHFASASDVKDFKEVVNQRLDVVDVSIAYGQYYDRLDDFDEATDEDNENLAEEYKRQMERIKVIICEHDPKWERCKEED